MSLCFPYYLMDDKFQLLFPKALNPLKLFSAYLSLNYSTQCTFSFFHTVLVTSDNIVF